ncbi:MAG: hypothetical protein AB1792_04990, partial [Candidatus Zixiibacteriota bacterium]
SAASHDPRPYIRPPSPNLARRTDANHQLLDAKSVRLELKQDIKEIAGFRVLFIVPGSLTENGSPAGRLANMLAAMPRFGTRFATSELFWFAPFESIDLENPLSVFDRFWFTANPQRNLQSLIEDDPR